MQAHARRWRLKTRPLARAWALSALPKDAVEVGTAHVPSQRVPIFGVPFYVISHAWHICGGLPSWRNPAKHPTSPHGSMAAGDCSDAAVQGLCAGRGMVEARGRSCWGTAGAHRSKQRSHVRLRRNTGPKATRPPAWECWRTGKLTLNPRNHRGERKPQL